MAAIRIDMQLERHPVLPQGERIEQAVLDRHRLIVSGRPQEGWRIARPDRILERQQVQQRGIRLLPQQVVEGPPMRMGATADHRVATDHQIRSTTLARHRVSRRGIAVIA